MWPSWRIQRQAGLLAFRNVWHLGSWEPGDLDWHTISDLSLFIKCFGPWLGTTKQWCCTILPSYWVLILGVLQLHDGSEVWICGSLSQTLTLDLRSVGSSAGWLGKTRSRGPLYCLWQAHTAPLPASVASLALYSESVCLAWSLFLWWSLFYRWSSLRLTWPFHLLSRCLGLGESCVCEIWLSGAFSNTSAYILPSLILLFKVWLKPSTMESHGDKKGTNFLLNSTLTVTRSLERDIRILILFSGVGLG